MKSPLSIVKQRFESKEKLVAAVEAFTKDDALWLGRTNDDKGLARVSNAKLLRLHATFSEVKEKFGTREKLIDAIVAAENRTKDAGYKKRLEAHPVPRLYDQYKASAKRTKGAAPKAEAKPAPKAEAKAAPKAAKKAAPKAKPAK